MAVFTRFLVALSMVAALAAPLNAQTASTDASANKLWRRPAVERPRRMIFNNDGNDPITKIKRPSVDDMLAARTAGLAGSQVDAIFYCTFCAGFGVFSHLTKVGQVFTAHGERFEHNQMAAFAAAGVDPLRVMIDFAHKNRMELFWSMRMNDTHDGGVTNGQGPVLFAENKLKNAHPEYLLGNYREKLPHGSWSGVDYARPEIRELAFRFFEEVCRNYDVDGVELDFFRHPVFFKSNTRGEAASEAERAAMTELVRRIRTMADEVGRARGRPILIAMRLPDSVPYCRALGLELDRWIQDDLLDLLIPAGYFQLNDWGYSVALARQHGIKVYPSFDGSRVKDDKALALRKTDLAYRGLAADAWLAGGDGIYLFNVFDPKSPRWRELGDPRLLATLDKDYVGSFYGVGVAAGGNLPHAAYQTVETLNPARPKLVARGRPARGRVNLGESFAEKIAPRLTLRLRFAVPVIPESVVVRMNGHRLRPGRSVGDWLEFSLAAGDGRPRENEVEIALADSGTAELKWTDLHVQVRHPARP